MSGAEKQENIIICEANEHNLKNISVNVPLDKFTCVIGPSGCGKSSLVYDTIYAESQRNFLESMSGNMYGQKLMDKPKVGKISNLRPALNVSQNYYNVNPRSTIGTITDIAYYLRTIYSLFANEHYGLSIDANYFSTNNPSSCCKKCKGLGYEYRIDINKVIPNPSKSLKDGGILYFKGTKGSQESKVLEALCDYYGIDIDTKVSDLSNEQFENLMYSNEEKVFNLRFQTPKGRYKQKDIRVCGAAVELEKKLEDVDTPSTFANISKYLKTADCSVCNGTRLKNSVLEIKVKNKSIADAESMSLENLMKWIEDLSNSLNNMGCKEQIQQLISNISYRLDCMIRLKLGYLSLNRSIPTLSGGEVQRIRIANQLTCSLTGMLYILDEPCKGLHYRNINSILEATKLLVNEGNTVLAIEHNNQYISESDYVIEMGPVGGPKGGYIISEGKRKEKTQKLTFKNENKNSKYISVSGINYHNLRDVSAQFPISEITCVTGVSGSGKSSLIHVISECIDKQKAIDCVDVKNTNKVKKVIFVNQQPIGKTPRSTVISYLGIYDNIRDIFSKEKSAKELDLTASDFSMNVQGGRCECCQGTGKKKIELTYLPDSYIECPECHGQRFSDDILKVTYNGLNISQVLEMPISDVYEIFKNNNTIESVLKCMIDIGLGYLSLGQMSMNLSGGEAQRIKLAKCLGVKSNGKNLYILDEPTSGLSSGDISLLEKILTRIKANGDTILIIEHNIDFISQIADYMIDLGIDAGENGGNTIIQGVPLSVIANEKSSWYDIVEHQ